MVVAAPDVLAHSYLLRNRHAHSGHYHAVRGTVSSSPLRVGGLSGYAGWTTSGGGGKELSRVDVPYIREMVASRINVVLIDCKGRPIFQR